jgi:undecaprenyl-diphosphatase
VDARPPPELRKPHPPSLAPRALAIAGWSAFLVAGLVFLAIAWNITGHSALVSLDGRLADWLHHHSHRALSAFFFAVTNLHSPAAISAASIVFGAVLARLRQWYWLLTLAAAVGGGMLVNTVLKFAYERLRPRFDDPLLTLTSYSFPSGHTAGAVLFYGVLAAFLVSRFYDWRARAACVAGAIGMVVLVAFSRMYLGVHYLSDVLAAACSSTAWLVLCLAGGHALVRGKLRLQWVVGAFFFLLLIAIAVLIPDEWWARFENMIERMNPLVAVLAFASAYAVALLLLLPAWIFPIAAGAIFGFLWGVFAALIAVTASAFAGLLISRYVVRGRMERIARKNDVFKAVDHAVAKEPRKIVALLRMAPVIPCGLKSYFLGVTRVRPEDYLLATLAGVTPDVLVKVYLGAAGRDVIAHGGALNWALLGAGIVAMLALTLIVGRKVRKALNL